MAGITCDADPLVSSLLMLAAAVALTERRWRTSGLSGVLAVLYRGALLRSRGFSSSSSSGGRPSNHSKGCSSSSSNNTSASTACSARSSQLLGPNVKELLLQHQGLLICKQMRLWHKASPALAAAAAAAAEARASALKFHRGARL